VSYRGGDAYSKVLSVLLNEGEVGEVGVVHRLDANLESLNAWQADVRGNVARQHRRRDHATADRLRQRFGIGRVYDGGWVLAQFGCQRPSAARKAYAQIPSTMLSNAGRPAETTVRICHRASSYVRLRHATRQERPPLSSPRSSTRNYPGPNHLTGVLASNLAEEGSPPLALCLGKISELPLLL